MAQNKLNKLELTWIGKYDEDKQPIEPRILIEDSQYSYGEVERGVLPNGKPWNGNMLIHGDNLLALKALEQEYAGCVKSIYIDPHFVPVGVSQPLPEHHPQENPSNASRSLRVRPQRLLAQHRFAAGSGRRNRYL